MTNRLLLRKQFVSRPGFSNKFEEVARAALRPMMQREIIGCCISDVLHC